MIDLCNFVTNRHNKKHSNGFSNKSKKLYYKVRVLFFLLCKILYIRVYYENAASLISSEFE